MATTIHAPPNQTTISGFRDGWRNCHSVFDWAEKGAWKCSKDEEVNFEGRKFRIGFEPLFVDFTQEGAVYITFLLFKWFALGIVAGFVKVVGVVGGLFGRSGYGSFGVIWSGLGWELWCAVCVVVMITAGMCACVCFLPCKTTVVCVTVVVGDIFFSATAVCPGRGPGLSLSLTPSGTKSRHRAPLVDLACGSFAFLARDAHRLFLGS